MFLPQPRHAGVCAAALMLAAIVPHQAVSADQYHYLTSNEARGTSLSTQWQNSGATMTRGPDGTVIYLYGQTQPSVVCSPLQLCEIQLQAGEMVRDVLVGDTVRWKVEPATSGSPEGQRIHLIVKPSDPGLQTSMVVTTSRRTYHIRLKSQSSGYMARVAFEYPEDVQAQFDAINARIEVSTIPGAGIPAENLDFNFSVQGQARWRPTRVYTDGMKTYIQFPGQMTSGDAPVLFVISGGENRIVNYRLNGTMMIVDYVFDRAVLLSGVGRSQQKVTIQRRG
ncbi:P-type conjugative transfer protein TrbG [Pelagibacterium halotolerans]|uniref:P-type conjugative transfer protein TrbG n=1 Tax=Pelagibacterium halotolerans TaxID=531813 RepID=UPI00384ED879